MPLLLAGHIYHNMTVIHHHQPVAIGNGIAHIVGDHHGGQVIFFHNSLGSFQHLGGGLGIKSRGVLVQQKQVGLFQRCHQKGQSLTLTAGQQADLGGQPVFQA